jgi:hypothetical protein
MAVGATTMLEAHHRHRNLKASTRPNKTAKFIVKPPSTPAPAAFSPRTLATCIDNNVDPRCPRDVPPILDRPGYCHTEQHAETWRDSADPDEALDFWSMSDIPLVGTVDVAGIHELEQVVGLEKGSGLGADNIRKVAGRRRHRRTTAIRHASAQLPIRESNQDSDQQADVPMHHSGVAQVIN